VTGAAVLCSVAVCQQTAIEQNAVVALLQQVLITRSVGWHTAACLLKINRLGASFVLKWVMNNVDCADAGRIRHDINAPEPRSIILAT
jgi:hypothetical protein